MVSYVDVAMLSMQSFETLSPAQLKRNCAAGTAECPQSGNGTSAFETAALMDNVRALAETDSSSQSLRHHSFNQRNLVRIIKGFKEKGEKMPESRVAKMYQHVAMETRLVLCQTRPRQGLRLLKLSTAQLKGTEAVSQNLDSGKAGAYAKRFLRKQRVSLLRLSVRKLCAANISS